MPESPPFLRLPAEDLDQVVDAIGPRWERLRGKRLLLTGGTGFIGKWLLGTFLHANRRQHLSAQVLVVSRRPELFLKEFPELCNAPEVTWLKSDVRAIRPEDVGDCAFAIHAATDVVAASAPPEILDTCITGTKRVLEAITPGDEPRRVLLISSGAVYGRVPSELGPIPENWIGAPDPLDPASAYGEGKRISELLAAMATAARPKLEASIARCFAFVGPHLPLDKHFAIGNFIRAAMRNENILIQGDGTPQRSYLYAADLAHWLWVLLFDASSCRAYNIGGSEALSISELAHRVKRVLGGTGEVQITRPPQPGSKPQTYLPMIKRISDELALVPTIDLDEAILRTARWVNQYSGN